MTKIVIELDPQEVQAFQQLLDIALRHSGIAALNVVAAFVGKVAAATAAAAVEG
ncbi:hypothetical protein KKP04_08605 [Rhodomicrobium sp. Az07]|uniref:hypothetical protein n=1 Tax=Rhodomicrobium sp. Az07 TaxID=2839034 RepID=UPI001BE5428D|nr:hypothetical protein [Rhodomicrobium sp. Az07]MBT3070926.1 hypothetical protein [Rhodomicrobium sp. Az07]